MSARRDRRCMIITRLLDLRPADICIVVEQYADGKFERCFHLHVRKSRLPQRARAELLHTLVARFYGSLVWDLIVSCLIVIEYALLRTTTRKASGIIKALSRAGRIAALRRL